MSPSRPRDALRPVEIDPNFTDAPAASVLIACGQTRVLCTATLEDKVPPFREHRGGWLTAEYAMLPGSTGQRKARASGRGGPDGRATEIQRLVGRALRAGFDLDRLGERTLWVDCDVLQADGGTRTASITGGYVAARLALERVMAAGALGREVLRPAVAAVSVGLWKGQTWLDLDYALDSRADVDLNVVMAADGRFIEVQGTAEGQTFSRAELDALLDLAALGTTELFTAQEAAVRRGLDARPRL